MAKALVVARAGITASIFALLAIIFIAGCQQSKSTIVQKLPAPNLDGPVVSGPAPVAKIAPATRPAVNSAPTMASAQKSKGQRGGVPQEWLINVPANSWQYIVIHHSATPAGNAASFDRMHKAKGWDELGYHFVIGNGTGSGDGQIEVGPRWSKQKWGAHAKTADQRFNNYGIGICLVGNFDIERPTKAQMESVERLVAYLMKTYRIPAVRVMGHSETKATDCPGRHMSVAEVRRAVSRLVEEDAVPVERRHLAGVELLKNVD
ncbi:MAG TPA: peptidoglycan recognition family protein [Tepidisphaeraceae bacterium]|nr:peptidoglycan recognition family protein [Tepidisphaeraceae bacterium]